LSPGASGNIDLVLYGNYEPKKCLDEDESPSSFMSQPKGYASLLQSKSRQYDQLSKTALKTKTDRTYAVNKEEILPLKNTKLE
jgi:hypothetical protein